MALHLAARVFEVTAQVDENLAALTGRLLRSDPPLVGSCYRAPYPRRRRQCGRTAIIVAHMNPPTWLDERGRPLVEAGMPCLREGDPRRDAPGWSRSEYVMQT